MTRLVATDYSDMPLLPPWVLIVAALLVLAAARVIRAVRNAPLRDAEPSAWDERDGVTDVPRCWTSGPRGGHAYRVIDGVWTCVRCGDRREAG